MLALALALLQTAQTAQNYACSPVPSSSPVVTQAWVSRCIPYQISRAGTLFTGPARRELIAQSFAVWTSNRCTDLVVFDAGYTDDTSGFDITKPGEQRNVVVSIEDAGLADEFPENNLLAVTLTHFVISTGEIIDADILMNSLRYDFEDLTDVPACMSRITARGPYDLRNTLVHEMGHFFGLDHTPLSPESTMYPMADPCETKKRDLFPVDSAGICGIYPAGQALPKTCSPPATGYAVAGLCDFREQCSTFDVSYTPLDTPGCAAPSKAGGCRCAAPVGDDHLLLGFAVLGGLLVLGRSRQR